MGYSPNYEPSLRLFCGFPHLKIARDALASAASEASPSVRAFGFLFLAKVELSRSINAVLGLPLFGKPSLEQSEQSWRDIPSDLRAEIMNTLEKDFEVHYAGTNQYGYPDFSFTKGEERASLTETGNLEIIREAFEERMQSIQDLMRLVIRLFGEVYISDKGRDLFCYGPLEDMDEKEAFMFLESHQIVESAQEAMRMYNNDIDLALKDAAISEALHRVEVEHWLDYHEDAMWNFDECASICHWHSW